MHCSKRVSFWGTSYSRPPTHTSFPPVTHFPCYKILAAPLRTNNNDKQEFLCSHYINFREREMNKNTSRKMHTLWSIDSQEENQ